MLGRKERRQPELCVAGSLRDLLLDDHVLVRVDQVLDLGWLQGELAELYDASTARPSIDPKVAVRLMLTGAGVSTASAGSGTQPDRGRHQPQAARRRPSLSRRSPDSPRRIRSPRTVPFGGALGGRQAEVDDLLPAVGAQVERH